MTLYFKDGTNSGTMFQTGNQLNVNATDPQFTDVSGAGQLLGGFVTANLNYYTVA